MLATESVVPIHARVVGELACQRDSYLRTLQSVVVSCERVAAAASDSKRTKKNKADSGKDGSSNGSSAGAEGMWEIEFEDTILFPEGGGQPTDHGTLTPTATPNVQIPVTAVQRRGLRALHFSPTALPPGTIVTQEVDFTRRWDHMQQHTGQHLLSAILDTYDRLETLGWSMGSDGGMNYVELGRKPTAEEIEEVQRKCNEAISRNVAVTVGTPVDANKEHLPEDYDAEKGIVRVVKIGDIDENPCCGTHLSQTSHISLVLLHHTQPIRGTNTRLFFTCGDRAIKLATESTQAVRGMSSVLSCGSSPAEALSRVTKVSADLTDARRRVRKLEAEIASFEAQRVMRELVSAERNIAWVYRPDVGMDYITSITQELKLSEVPEGVVVLAAGEGAAGGPIVIVGNEKRVDEVAGKVKGVVGSVKGGGKGGRWQGKVGVWAKGEADALQKLVASGL